MKILLTKKVLQPLTTVTTLSGKVLTLTGELILLPKCEIHIKDKIFYNFNLFLIHGGTQKGSHVDLSVGVPDNSMIKSWKIVEISRKVYT